MSPAAPGTARRGHHGAYGATPSWRMSRNHDASQLGAADSSRDQRTFARRGPGFTDRFAPLACLNIRDWYATRWRMPQSRRRPGLRSAGMTGQATW
jgi:hypothetical protein